MSRLTIAGVASLAGAFGAFCLADDGVRPLEIRRAVIPLRGTSPTRPIPGVAKLEVRIALDDALFAFDPRAAEVAFSLGGSHVFGSAPGDASGRWRGRRGVWTWSPRSAGGPRMTLDLRPAGGRVVVQARRTDLGVLAVAGPGDALFTLRLGDVSFVQQQDLGTFGRRWHFPLTAADLHEGPIDPDDPDDVLPPPQGLLTTRPLGAGITSAYTLDQFAVIRELNEWTGTWRAAAGSAPLPAVDFSREMVVFVAIAGPGNAPGKPYPTVISSVYGDGSVLRINVNEWDPSRSCQPVVAADWVKRSYTFVSVPRSYAIPIFHDYGNFPCF